MKEDQTDIVGIPIHSSNNVISQRNLNEPGLFKFLFYNNKLGYAINDLFKLTATNYLRS